MTTIDAQCHCGNVSVRFTTGRPSDHLGPVECPCGFCRMHGAVYVADPDGQALISAGDPAEIICYRFGQQTTDYLLCRRCGNFVAALVESDGRYFAALNLALTGEQPAAERVDTAWAAQPGPARLAFRAARWTPASLRGINPAAG